uniref:Uncharacterized protein n=1 Tax=Prevotella sp. GTC17262 TaxID=3236797 RepID=A0AB33JPS7_9BACT
MSIMIDQDEEILRREYGKAECFRVPDGYFNQLADEVMGRIGQPEQAVTVAPRRRVRRRIVSVVAAAACIGVVGIALWTYFPQSGSKQVMPSDKRVMSVNANETAVDEVADYAMLDNEDIYASLVNE